MDAAFAHYSQPIILSLSALCMQVGLADACVDPTATVIRVLQWFVSQTKSRTDRDMYDLEMTRHYLMNCSLPNPVVSPLFNISSSKP